MNALNKKIAGLTIFSIAMGFMESAIVVYLRKIYYPTGFQFPLIPIDNDIAQVEFFREAATIIMLLWIGILVGRTVSQKFAFFIFCFAVWDLFYYIFLKLLIDWPKSLLTWDILFLIPVPWVGPVIAPCIVSATMIILTLLIVYYSEKRINTRINGKEWGLLSLGSLTVIASFVWDYFQFHRKVYADQVTWTLSNETSLFQEISTYVPNEFNWGLFIAGELIINYSMWLYVKRMGSFEK